MLRTTSLDNYDKWTEGKLPFSSPEVKHAAELIGKIWLDEKYVYGGRKGIVSTSFGDSPVNMFSDPPKCWLHKQGNFITSFLPAATQKDLDNQVGIFQTPSVNGTTPVEGGVQRSAGRRPTRPAGPTSSACNANIRWSRQAPLTCMYAGRSPSARNPSFSTTRSELAFSGRIATSRRCSFTTVKA